MTVTAISPASGTTGTVVTVTGTNLTGATGVTLGGVPVTGFAAVSATQVTGTVAATTTTGVVDVVAISAAGNATLKAGFTYTVATPGVTLTAITPNTGTANTQVTISGTGLSNVADVQIGGYSITNLIATATEVQGNVGSSPTTGVMDVVAYDVNGNLLATLPAAFTYTTTTPTPPPAGVNGFANAAALQNPRGMHTATALQDGSGRILVVGGVDAQATGPNLLPESEIYDPLANTFTLVSTLSGQAGYMVAPLPTQPGYGIAVARINHSAVTLQDTTNRVLIVGGFGCEGVDANNNPVMSQLATAFLFDPSTNTFAQTQNGNLLTPRENASVVPLGDGTVLIAGGFNQQLFPTANPAGGTEVSSEIYDPGTDSFTVTSQATLNPRQNAAFAPWNGGALICGGLTIQAQGAGIMPAADFYTPAFSGQAAGWYSFNSNPAYDRMYSSLSPIMDPTGIPGGDLILATGTGVAASSTTGAPSQVLAIEHFTGATQTWATSAATLSTGRDRAAVGAQTGTAASGTTTALPAYVLFAAGASYDAGGNFLGALSSADLYNPLTDTCTPYNMATSRNGATCTPLSQGNGGFIVIGGFTGGTSDPLGLDGASVPMAEILTAVPANP
jgi:hypothetical protein